MSQGIIGDFRANAGRVGGTFEGRPLLLLHTVGARTGAPRICPLMYQVVPGGFAVFASKGGADSNPHWFHNLLAHPEAEVETGTETVPVTGRVAQGDERERIWSEWKRDWPFFADYERKTKRPSIPVVVLEAM